MRQRKKLKPKDKVGDSVRTADKKNVSSRGDNKKWSYKLYTITEFTYDTIPSYHVKRVSERYKRSYTKKIRTDKRNKSR